jgi:hypothetical protein
MSDTPSAALSEAMARAQAHVERKHPDLAYAEPGALAVDDDPNVHVSGHGDPDVAHIPEMADADVSALIDAAESPLAPPELRPVRLGRGRRLWGGGRLDPIDAGVPIDQMPGAAMVEPQFSPVIDVPRPPAEANTWVDCFLGLCGLLHKHEVTAARATFTEGVIRKARDAAGAAVDEALKPVVTGFWAGPAGMKITKMRQRVEQLRLGVSEQQRKLAELRQHRTALVADEATQMADLAGVDEALSHAKRLAASGRGLLRESQAACRAAEAAGEEQLRPLLVAAARGAAEAAERRLGEARAFCESALAEALPAFVARDEAARLCWPERVMRQASHVVQQGPQPAEQHDQAQYADAQTTELSPTVASVQPEEGQP